MSPFPARRPPSLLPTSVPSSPKPSSTPPPTTDLAKQFGRISSVSKKGVFGGLGGVGEEERESVRRGLEENHLKNHPLTEDGRPNLTAPHLLAAYSLGASASFIDEISRKSRETVLPIGPLEPITITELNWTLYLGSPSFYPTYLTFFHRLLSTTSHTNTSTVLTLYLPPLLSRSFSHSFLGFILVGLGIEFSLPPLLAEGLATAAISPLSQIGDTLNLYKPPKTSPTSSFLKYLSSTTLYPLELLSFTRTHSRLATTTRKMEGMSAMSVFERICETREGDDEAVDSWCKEWEGNGGGRWEEEKEGKKGEVGWEEVVRKAEEVVWLATVIFAAKERREVVRERGLDYYSMTPLTAALFLPPILELLSPAARPVVLQFFFRGVVWNALRGRRPKMVLGEFLSPSPTVIVENVEPETPTVDSNGHIKEPTPTPFSTGENLWFSLLAKGSVHPDSSIPLVIRTLFYAATWFGDTPKGVFRSSLGGSGGLDGTIFLRAAILTLQTPTQAPWTSSRGNGKGKEREERETVTVLVGDGDSALLESSGTEGGWVGDGEKADEWEGERGPWEEREVKTEEEEEEEREREERELMA